MKKFYIYILLVVTSINFANAQSKDTKKADQLFDRLAYTEAIQEYNGLIEKGKADEYVYTQLARTYTILNDTKKAESFYKRVVKNKKANPETLFAYAEILKANGKSSDYKKWMKRFVKANPNDPKAAIYLKNQDYLEELEDRDPLYVITNAEKVNTKYSDFGSFTKDNKIYFSSSRNTDRKNHNLNGEPFLDIYSATTDGSKMSNVEMLEGDVNSKYHEGTIAITPDGKRMFFDRNNYFEGDLEKDEEGINQINLYTAEKVAGEWTNIEPVSFNDDNYSTGHPAISPDGKTLYFSSDKPGGQGGSDIYMVELKADNSFGEPKNLGNQINTIATEVFPFIDSNGSLYFSSNGHLGLGGLDVFLAEKNGNSFTFPENLGPGVNSGNDDFGANIDPEKGTGYVSSNRKGGKGGDDIYLLGKLPPCDVDVTITVEDADGNGISKAFVEIMNITEGTTDSDTATTTGKYLFSSKCKREYKVMASADGYLPAERTVSIAKKSANLTIALQKEPVITPDEVVLNPIYFDFDKWNIRPDAAAELDRLVAVMNKYPDLKISAESHTDVRGPESYNQTLSQKRAESMRDYIISKGIDTSRISGLGKGESEPAVSCEGSACSKEDHQLNRRCAFKIVK